MLSFPVGTRAATYERTQLVFGDVEFSIRIETDLPGEKAFRVIEKGFAVVREQDGIFSTFRADSEISRLNALPKPARGVRVSREMAAVLGKTLDFTRLTRGYFDLTFEMESSGADAVRLSGRRRVDLLREDLRLNPTGMIKGYTVDAIIALLKRDRRVASALVAAGGDIARFDRSGSVETIGLHAPLEYGDKRLSVTLGDGAVSTSGQYERGRHIKNTGGGAVEHLQASVTAPDCTTSDGLDNAFLFMTAKDVRRTLNSFPGTRAILYEKDGKVLTIP